MRDEQFEMWLRRKYPKPGSWKTYRSDTRRIAKHKGDLDEIYEADQFQSLLDGFRCSESKGIPPTHDIPHNADPYKAASFFRRCLVLYAQFYVENPREVGHRSQPIEAPAVQENLEALEQMNDDLNIVLYGPPGTGKTYHWFPGRLKFVMVTYRPIARRLWRDSSPCEPTDVLSL